jgi:hypothetical protein
MSNNLKKITTAAKKLRKEHPKMQWQQAVKKASSQLKKGHKMAGTSTATPARRQSGTVIVGTKKKSHRRVSGTKSQKVMGVLVATAGSVAGTYVGMLIAQRNTNATTPVMLAGLAAQFFTKEKSFLHQMALGASGGAGAMLLKQNTKNIPMLSGVLNLLPNGYNNDMGNLVAGTSDAIVFDYTGPTLTPTAANPSPTITESDSFWTSW